MSQVSGLALKILPMYVEEKMGRDGLEKWKNTLADDVKEVYFDPSYILDKWFDINRFYIEPTKSVCDLFYGGDEKAAWDLGRFSADYALNGVLKVFIRMGTTMFLVNRAANIISKYYNPMEVEVTENSKTSAVLAITDFSDYHLLLEYRLCGWIERALEISGCVDIHVGAIKAYTKESPSAEIKLQWK
jgi:hypothetical protein